MARVGSIKAGSTTYELRLAEWRGAAAYRPKYDPVWPQAQDIPGAEGKVAGDPNVREWHIAEWQGGEGEDLWKPGSGKYDVALNVGPRQVGDGLVLGASQATTVTDAGAAIFLEGRHFGLAQGQLWAAADATVHWWQPATSDWDATGWATGGTTNQARCVIDQNDGTNLLIGFTDGTTTHSVRRVSSATSAAVTGLTITASAGFCPVLRSWGGILFHLNGDDLYSFTMSGDVATATLRADVTGRSNDWLGTNGYETSNRMSSSDKGPVWIQRLDNGQTLVWEYNVALDTATVIGKLPVDFATPYSVFWGNGFYFVGFRYAGTHAETGDAYIYYFRAGQKGVAGPVRSLTAASASKPILLAGIIGDDLVFYYDGATWAYNLTSGGIYMVADYTFGSADNATVTEAITYGQSIFLGNADSLLKVERHNRAAYTTRAASWDSGRFDFGYPGVKKVLLDVAIVLEPLSAGNTVELWYSVEGGTFTQVTGTASTTSITTYTWVVSLDTGNVTGKDFEIRLVPLSDSTAETPVIRSVTARAASAAKQRSWYLETDAGTTDGGSDGDSYRSADVLASVDTIAQYAGVCLFTNPWGSVEAWDAATTHQVLVEKVLLVAPEGEEPYVSWQIRDRSYL